MLPKFLEVAYELDRARVRMVELKFSEADIEEELERIRARHHTGPNPFEDAARVAKAQKITLTLWHGLGDEARRDVRTGWLLGEADRSFHNQFARLAGYRTGCSAGCWVLVVTLVCQMVNAERRDAPEPCEAGWSWGRCSGGKIDTSEGTVGCPACVGGFQPCGNCGEAPATKVVPLGFYCAACEPEAY